MTRAYGARADEVAINLAIKQIDAELVSVCENIGKTPPDCCCTASWRRSASSTAATWRPRSSMDACRRLKTAAHRAAHQTDYLNVPRVENGRESRNMEIDPVRGPLMAWTFRAYASDEWTIRNLLAELTARVSASPPTTPPSDSQPSRSPPYGLSCAAGWPSCAPRPIANESSKDDGYATSKGNARSSWMPTTPKAIPLDLLRSEQDRLTSHITHTESRLAEIDADFQTAEANLERALTRAGDCEAAYREASPSRSSRAC